MNCDSTTKFYDVANEVAQKLHCVVCSGQNIASSEAEFAVNVRTDICQYAHDGMTQVEITEQIIADYGADLAVSDAQSNEMIGLNALMLLLLIVGVIIIKKIIRK